MQYTSNESRDTSFLRFPFFLSALRASLSALPASFGKLRFPKYNYARELLFAVYEVKKNMANEQANGSIEIRMWQLGSGFYCIKPGFSLKGKTFKACFK